MPPEENKPKEENSVFLIRNMPSKLHARFKAYCARQQVSMNDKLIELIRECLTPRIQE